MYVVKGVAVEKSEINAAGKRVTMDCGQYATMHRAPGLEPQASPA